MREQMIKEKTDLIEQKLTLMAQDKSRNTFWKEKKRMIKDRTLESLVIRNEHGERQYDPMSIKEHTAKYYENLYKQREYKKHPYHDEIKTKIDTYSKDYMYTPTMKWPITKLPQNKK